MTASRLILAHEGGEMFIVGPKSCQDIRPKHTLPGSLNEECWSSFTKPFERWTRGDGQNADVTLRVWGSRPVNGIYNALHEFVYSGKGLPYHSLCWFAKVSPFSWGFHVTEKHFACFDHRPTLVTREPNSAFCFNWITSMRLKWVPRSDHLWKGAEATENDIGLQWLLVVTYHFGTWSRLWRWCSMPAMILNQLGLS